MFLEKIKLFFAKNVAIKYIFIFCILIVTLYTGILLYNDIRPQISENTKGAIGTLLGAIVGGCFTLWGSLIINKNVQTAQNAIKRKGLIYKPLYDELKDIHENILINNPYPSHISFEKEPQAYILFPQYTVWGRIKNDSRFFEVPPKISKAMEDLYKAIEKYQDEYTKTYYTFDRFYREEAKRINDIPLPEDGRYGGTLLCYVLDNDKQKCEQPLWFNKNLTREEVEKFWDTCYLRAVECIDYKRLKDAKKLWNTCEKNVIDLLSVYIQYIIVKYER